MGGFHTDFLSNEKNILQTFSFLRQWSNHKAFFDEEQGKYVCNIFERLCSENGKNNEIIKAYIVALLFEIDEANRKSTNIDNNLNINNKLCKDFVEAVFEKPDQRLSVSHYAEKLCVSQTHLQKIVKRFTGKTPLEWLNEALILEAKVLLSNTDLKISEISKKVGIFDPSYFARFFKKNVGLSPVDYRNKLGAREKVIDKFSVF